MPGQGVRGYSTTVGHSILAPSPAANGILDPGESVEVLPRTPTEQVEPCGGAVSPTISTNPRRGKSGVGTTPDPTLDHREVPRELPGPTGNRSFRIVLGLNLENRCSNKCTHPYRLEGNLE